MRWRIAIRDDLAKVKWHRIALDEAQKIKNPSAASSVAIRSLSAPRRIALTGTPIENHLSELWSIMDVLNPGCSAARGIFASGSPCRSKNCSTRIAASTCGG
jgi:hypothetical protein